ncbi:Lipid A 3-O-deacylase (PagL) [Methylophaga frappieri]|uniref:Lipid A 3-O-deacylase (PagL) n=1 Tax=Methylophaga frappieri (strain ATCC BAA-2434 / DSM 25690 / JAM7) TaxID=754477 RepID=I1YIL5_METFJ|nr:acyloxyacyl hydrolase [Methylophaga frappieri]AFJ02758.1 Lipid A 3-O-deacylase (PagL) [Methylophaga frappieri]
MSRISVLSFAVLLFVFVTPTRAEDAPEFVLSGGAFEAFATQRSAEFGLAYRFSPRKWSLIPEIGLSANSDGGYWAHLGLRYDLQLNQKWLITPQLALVGYENGGGEDLGSGLLFRSGIELGYRLTSGSKLAITLYHLSNAGLSGNNPGSESVILSYSFTR